MKVLLRPPLRVALPPLNRQGISNSALARVRKEKASILSGSPIFPEIAI